MKQPYPNADDLMARGEALHEPSELSTDTERTVRVQRSVFAGTLIAGTAPAPPSEARERQAPAASARPKPPAPPTTGATRPPASPLREPTPAEPLRMPSNRPPPAPYEQSRSARPDSTLLMPGSAPLQTPSPTQRTYDNKKTPVVQHPAIAIKATLQASPPPVASPRASAAPPVPPQRSTATPPSTKPPAAKPAVSGPPRASGPAAASPAPTAPTSKRADAVAAPVQARSSMPAAARQTHGGGEPLRLQLSERDFLPELATAAARPVVPRSRAPWILAGVAIAVVLGVLGLWLGSRDARPAVPQPAIDGVRASAVPAAVPPPAAAPTAPVIAPTPATTVGTEPRAAQPQPAAQAPHAEPAAAKVKAETAPVAAATTPSRNTAAREAQGRKRAETSPARPVAPGPGAPPETRASIEGARAALKALESQPVISVKPTDEPSAPSDDAPSPERAQKASPPPSPEADSPEPPPPAPEGE